MAKWLLVVLLGACLPEERLAPPPVVPADPAPAVTAAGVWSDELAALTTQIESMEARYAATNSWLDADRAAAMLRQRARLSGQLDDYERAESLLEKGFSTAPAVGGPLLGRARLHLSLHRLSAAEADADTIAAQAYLQGSTRDSLADLRADIALQRGQLDVAQTHWTAADQARPSITTAASLGRIAWLRGDFDNADQNYVTALGRYHGATHEPAAWVHLQRGLLDLDQGDPAAALEHYTAAAAELDGYWLIEEHIAEAMAGTGRLDEAEARYRDVVKRTGHPELQGALGALLVERGQEAEGRALLASATQGFDAYRDRFPEAAAGHALEHALEWGDDAAATLTLAEDNARLRPNGSALALLSSARLAVGDVPGARDAAAQGLATGTQSVALFLTAAAAAADPPSRDQHLAAARRIDPAATLPPGP